MKARRRMLRNILPGGRSSSADAANPAVPEVNPADPVAAADQAVSLPMAANPGEAVASASAAALAVASASAAELAVGSPSVAEPSVASVAAAELAAEPAVASASASASAAEPTVAPPKRPKVSPEVTQFWQKAREALKRKNELRASLGRPPLDHKQTEEFLRTRVALATEIKELEYIRRGGPIWE